MTSNWFTTSKLRSDLYLTREEHFFEGNRANIWLVKGPSKDVVIDTGLGVHDLRLHLETLGLVDSLGGQRECIVVCTHNHFDHCGGAFHFGPNVFVHQDDLAGLRQGRQTETLNYVKPCHFHRQPHAGFSARQYKVPATTCQPLRDGDRVELGGGEHLEVLHVPGHTRGSIALYSPAKRELFTGDFVYECGYGGNLMDWLPTSSVASFVDSAERTLDWLREKEVDCVYPGHFDTLTSQRTQQLLQEYVDARDSGCSKCYGSGLQAATWTYFLLGCFRCCPC